MEQITDYLEKLGLSELEAKIYLTLLQTGTVSVKSFAPMIGLKRTTAYLYIDPLIEKGLVIKVIQGNKKQIAPANPDILKDLVAKKVQVAKLQTNVAETIEKEFPNILQTLTTTFIEKNTSEDAEIKYYKGKLGVQKIYEDVLKAKEQRSYVDTTKVQDFFPENLQLFERVLAENPSTKMFEIFQYAPPEKAKVFPALVEKYKNYAYKMLPKGMKLQSQDIFIYDNKVAIISFNDEISGVILQIPNLYANFKTLFDTMWQLLPDIQS